MKSKEYWISWAKAAGRFGSPGTAVNRNMLSRRKRRPERMICTRQESI